jgi:hypothetical protein
MKRIKSFKLFESVLEFPDKEYIEDVLMELPSYFKYTISYFDKPVDQVTIDISSKNKFTLDEISDVFNHLDNYLKGFGFRLYRRGEVDSKSIRNPATFSIDYINYNLHISYIRRN